MRYKIFIVNLFLILSSIFVLGQEPIIITGNIFDSSNGERLVFVNIGIEGTLIGTASNAFGEFKLSIPPEMLNKNLYFSAIGYQNLSIALQKYLNENLNEIKLKPLSYGIDDIEINTASRVLYKIVNDAANAIPIHFINKSFNYKAIYSTEEFTNQVAGRKRDALVLVSDTKGYGTIKNAFSDRNYKFLNVNRNFEIKKLSDGTTIMDELLAYDIARSPANILDISYLNDFNLELVGEEKILNDSVWVIEYNIGKPDLSRTGGLYVSSYKGKLYISKTNNILLKAETHIISSIQSSQGRTVAVEKINAQNDVNYHFTTTYKKVSDGYILDRISLNKGFLNTKKEYVQIVSSLIITEIDTTQPIMLTDRQYYEKMISDPNFWINIKTDN